MSPVKLEDLTFSSTQSLKLSHCSMRIKTWESQLPKDIVPRPTIGIDPGRNFGITEIFDDGSILIMGGTLDKGSWEDYGLGAYDLIREYAGPSEASIFCIEGASYGSVAGQVGLAQVRFGFYLGLKTLNRKNDIEIVPPATARKVAFGSGTTKAWELWPELNANAADSLGIALYGLLG